jgi:hypothetical protein
MASYLRQRCIRFLGLIWLCHQTHTACGGTKANEALLQILVGVGVNKLVSSLIVGNSKKLLVIYCSLSHQYLCKAHYLVRLRRRRNWKNA